MHLADSFSDNYYVGFVQGEAKSLVICYFERPEHTQHTQPAVFAQIQVEDEAKGTKTIYFVEPSSSGEKRHYIVYRSEDIASDLIANERFK